MKNNNRGILIIIGGAEDKENECIILNSVAKLSGGQNGKIIILTVATEYPDEVGKEYTSIFNNLGVPNVETVHIETREQANNKRKIQQMEDASCIFFTGGDQLKITSLIGGTKIENFFRISYKEGMVIAGTSAGASAMSETMIISGIEDESPKKCTVKMAPGLGLIEGVVIEQHFAQRGRIGRLLASLAQNPRVLGIGLDEDTAIIVQPDRRFKVIGSNAVTILDAVKCSYTNASESRPDDILALTDIVIHILPNEYEFDLNTRVPILRR